MNSSVENKEDQTVGLALGQGRLQRREVRGAVLVQRHDLAVEQAVGQPGGGGGDGGEAAGPLDPLPRAQLRLGRF